MSNVNKMYFFSEAAYFPEEIKILKEEKSKYDDTWTVTFETILQVLDVPNRNGRIYSTQLFKEIWDDQIIPKLKKRHLYGELGHPIQGYYKEDDAIARQLTVHPPYVSHLILDMKLDGSYVRGTVKTLSTPYGQIATKILLIDKGTLGFSLRALGMTRKGIYQGKPVLYVHKPFIFVTYDMVINPSNPATIFDYESGKNLTETVNELQLLEEAVIARYSKNGKQRKHVYNDTQAKIICLDNVCLISKNFDLNIKENFVKQLIENAIDNL